MLSWGLRCPHCREEAVTILKKMVLLPPRRVACASCARPVATPVLPLALLDVLLIIPIVWLATTTDLRPLLESLTAFQDRIADTHGHYVFVSGLFFAAFGFAWFWTLCIPLTRPPAPLYVPRLRHLPPALRRRRP